MDRQIKCLVRKCFVTIPASVVIISVFLAGCGEDEEPDPGEIINGLWTGNLISENTGQEKTYEAILSYGFNDDIMPPYYLDLIESSPKIAALPVGVNGVFKIQSDNQVDTLVVRGGFSLTWGLGLELGVVSADGFFITYKLMKGIIMDDMVEGSHEEFGIKDGDRYQVDAGIWSGTRKEKLP